MARFTSIGSRGYTATFGVNINDGTLAGDYDVDKIIPGPP
jgi:hypothetical protein